MSILFQRRLNELEQAVRELKEEVAELKAKRKPGRPRKKANAGSRATDTSH